MSALFYPGATRRDGPAGRVSGGPQPKHGAIYHSMVGTARPAQTANSWQFGVFKDGHVEQYYSVRAWCWHAGDRDDPGSDITNNRDLFGIEHEGGPHGNLSEPLTARQLTATIELTKWAVAEGHIHNLTRTGPHRGLWEHNEIRATACPSGRFTRIWATIIERAREDSDMLYIFKNPLKRTQWWVGDRIRSKRKVANTTELNALRRDGAKEIAVNEEMFNAMG